MQSKRYNEIMSAYRILPWNIVQPRIPATPFKFSRAFKERNFKNLTRKRKSRWHALEILADKPRKAAVSKIYLTAPRLKKN